MALEEAKALRAARLARGMSQLEVGIRAGLSPSLVGAIERGARLSERSRERLEAVLGDLSPRAPRPTLLGRNPQTAQRTAA